MSPTSLLHRFQELRVEPFPPQEFSFPGGYYEVWVSGGWGKSYFEIAVHVSDGPSPPAYFAPSQEEARTAEWPLVFWSRDLLKTVTAIGNADQDGEIE